MKVKDDIIWNLINEKKTQEENEINYIREKSHNEIAEWAKYLIKINYNKDIIIQYIFINNLYQHYI